jgi:hypothetical protein
MLRLPTCRDRINVGGLLQSQPHAQVVEIEVRHRVVRERAVFRVQLPGARVSINRGADRVQHVR